MKRYFRNPFASLLVAALALPLWAASVHQAGQQVFVGEITDAMCGISGSHTQMMNGMSSMGRDKDTCAKQCMRIGFAYVLLDPATRTLYHLDDPARAEPFVGRRVRIVGTLEDNKIQVTTIEAAN
jgi:hypothetical protein